MAVNSLKANSFFGALMKLYKDRQTFIASSDFRAFYYCKNCHAEATDVRAIKKCRCRPRKFSKFFTYYLSQSIYIKTCVFLK